METLKQSFKTLNQKSRLSLKRGGEEEEDEHCEKQPILLSNEGSSYQMKKTENSSGGDGSSDLNEVFVKISDDGDKTEGGFDHTKQGSQQIWRESSYDFRKDTVPGRGRSSSSSSSSNNGDGVGVDDPPSKLIGQFLHKQKASGEICLDMDLEMDELRTDQGSLSIVEESPSKDDENNFSFRSPKDDGNNQATVPEPIRRRLSRADKQGESPNSVISEGGGVGGGVYKDEILRCTSNSSFRRTSSILKTKTMKSRLMDPPPSSDRRSGRVGNNKSGQLRSGFLGEDEDDPFAEEDLPDEYKKVKFSFLMILEWVSLILVLGALVCSLTIHYFEKQRLWGLPLWKWELLGFVLLCGRLVSGWGIRLVVFFIERNFILRKRVLYFVYGVRKAVQNCLWLGLVLVAWHYLFDDKVAEVKGKGSRIPYVMTKILICLLVGTLLWLVKTLLVKVLASSFHVSTFFDRIQDALFNQYVIETLSGPPLIEIQHNQEEEEKVMDEVQKLQNAGAKMPADLKASAFPPPKSGRVLGSGRIQNSPKVAKSFASGVMTKQQDDGITIDHLHKLNQKNISAWNMKRLMNIVRHGVLSTLDEQIQDSTLEDESATTISSEREAKCAAKKIFNNVARPHSKFIYEEDLRRFMRDDEASKTMSLFEGGSESDKVSKRALKNWVVNAFRERRALALTLNDTKTAVNQLHHMINVVVGVVIVVIWLLILGIATTQLLVLVSSQLLLVVFMFGNTLKTVFEAIIFLFVMHPFDVGDRCEIDGVQMVVEEMNILTTVFLRFDNQKIYFPNSVLSTKSINNYYRSPDMGDAIDFCIHISTPPEKIATMKQRITACIESKKEHWYAAPMIVARDVDEMNKLKFSIWCTHRMNHQDMGERWTRRAYVLESTIRILNELDIEYRMLPLDVTVRNIPNSSRLPSNWTTCRN